MQNGFVRFAPAWFSMLAVCLPAAPVENLRPPRIQAHLRRLGYEICEKWPLRRRRRQPSQADRLPVHQVARVEKRGPLPTEDGVDLPLGTDQDPIAFQTVVRFPGIGFGPAVRPAHRPLHRGLAARLEGQPHLDGRPIRFRPRAAVLALGRRGGATATGYEKGKKEQEEQQRIRPECSVAIGHGRRPFYKSSFSALISIKFRSGSRR
ncbi:protein of unknown function [Methylacidimicrobium sp. AP8]|nr:protein of unknown function [Methylacidimicrobium sp. AP8]